MKKITCDSCSSEHAKSFKYEVNRSWMFIDLCVNCVQDFVLKNQIKLTEVTGNQSNKRVIHG